MIRAYQETYLSNAQAALGEAFDYAVHDCEIPGEQFVKLFTASTISRRMENGEPDYLAGKSGIELVADILSETTGKVPKAASSEHFGRSREYWIGWAVAYYQWWSGRKYSEIFSAVPFEALQGLYTTLHEADISKFVDILNTRIRETFPDTNLKRIRSNYGCTQAELARLSGVSLRSIQMYEQRKKDINKASAETLLALSKVLGCTMEDLIDR